MQLHASVFIFILIRSRERHCFCGIWNFRIIFWILLTGEMKDGVKKKQRNKKFYELPGEAAEAPLM